MEKQARHIIGIVFFFFSLPTIGGILFLFATVGIGKIAFTYGLMFCVLTPVLGITALDRQFENKTNEDIVNSKKQLIRYSVHLSGMMVVGLLIILTITVLIVPN